MTATDTLRLDGVAVGDLADVALEIASGEIVCLTGASGAGKSRLLRAVADLEPHAGEVSLGDASQASLPGHRWRRRVMLVPAESHWWAGSVGEHLDGGVEAADFDALGLEGSAAGWEVARLSSGEKQRLALLRALCREPGALLLDEPTANLDEATTRRVEAWLVARIRARGWPTLWVAHDLEQIRRVADRFFRIESGRLVEDDPWR